MQPVQEACAWHAQRITRISVAAGRKLRRKVTRYGAMGEIKEPNYTGPRGG